MTEEQLAKLPKWAQSEFRNLQYENEGMRAMFVNQPESPITIRTGQNTPAMTLPANTSVTFDRFTVWLKDGKLQIVNLKSPGEGIAVLPGGGSNWIVVCAANPREEPQ